MRELELDRIHEDDDHLILVDSDGETYTLRIDESLRAAVRRDRPALGMIRAEKATPLRPREIQAMLRAGRTAEAIAEMSGASLEHVRRFEGPVLAERAFVAHRARGFHVGRGGGPRFGDVVEERLRARQAEPERQWDAWRLENGTWTVELVFTAGQRERTAHWIVDVDRQTVLAEDDEARWLTDDDTDVDLLPPGRGRLTPIRATVYDVEADGEFDPAADTARSGLRSLPRRRTTSPHTSAAIDPQQLDDLQAQRGIRPLAGGIISPDSDHAARASSSQDAPVWESLDAEAMREHQDAVHEAEWHQDHRGEHTADDSSGHDDLDSDAPTEDVDAAPAESALNAVPRESEIQYLDTVDLTPLPGFEDAASAPEEPLAESPATVNGQTETPKAEPKPKKKSKRSSIPSWDDIVFGSRND